MCEKQVCERAHENRDKIPALLVRAQMAFLHSNNFQKLLGRKEESLGYYCPEGE